MSLRSKVKKFTSRTSTKCARLVWDLLENFSIKAIPRSAYTNYPEPPEGEEDVYDIVNAGPRHAFLSWSRTGKKILTHNCMLGAQYGVGAPKLGNTIAQVTKQDPKSVNGRHYIDLHKKAYPDLWASRAQMVRTYRLQGFLMLPDGWILFGDNPSDLSAANFPIQGLGGVLMREYVKRAHDADLTIISPLHDAIYGECYDFEVEKCMAILDSVMRDAKSLWIPGLNIRHDPGVHPNHEPWVEEKGERAYAELKGYLSRMDTEADLEQQLLNLVSQYEETTSTQDQDPLCTPVQALGQETAVLPDIPAAFP